ncbi:aminotransferase class I/II-fold pyridoxal phosphate-dependent enzyme [Nocardioides sp. B-3]|uniref:aminotransferase class I/II-fold pyridoxal phosphate-dependent enzyme n=1 Tax=Nocardioides sp. B-3 TaxID=2895565 RepID=UPI002152ECFF|nr:aminotransferase class I/II-fold pyridoxal phosphate-dependent enzyme [Nocardioides sp. B-3]UUZ61435.1 aminotransferase class I/II-fold pyridoxal phosphate-dependent enzyme [Nocardioides sp. B-3]
MREVAAELGVSPATVSSAWQALRRGTGVVVSRGRSGTFVRETPRARLSPRQRGLVGASPAGLRMDLSRGTPDPELLPSLGPAFGRVSARAGTGVYRDEPVLPQLRDVPDATWPYPSEAITVVDGATDGIVRVLEQCVHLGDRVVLESPGYPPFYDLVESLGAEIVPVESDDSGIRPASLRTALGARPVAVVLQPRAQNPTGISMSPDRARELAGVLSRRRKEPMPWVIEDDHSGAISTSPDVSLGSHIPQRVVHVRSFSKSHGPDLRIAAPGGPAELVDALVARRMLGPGWTSRMVQTILHDLLTRARSMDEVSEARRQYFGRQRDLTARLADPGMAVSTPDGINLWLPVLDERAALLHPAAEGIRVAGGSPFFPGDARSPHIRVTSGPVDPEHASEVAAAPVAAAAAV